jgi:hypothetical protein
VRIRRAKRGNPPRGGDAAVCAFGANPPYDVSHIVNRAFIRLPWSPIRRLLVSAHGLPMIGGLARFDLATRTGITAEDDARLGASH